MNSNDKTKITKSLEMMLASFPASQSGAAEAVVAAYLVAIDGFSADAVRQASIRYVRGEAMGQRFAFPPSSAAFSAEVRRQEGHLEREANPVPITWTRVERETREITPEERARNQHRFAEIINTISANALTQEAKRDRTERKQGGRTQ